jgi:hypothetical protein
VRIPDENSLTKVRSSAAIQPVVAFSLCLCIFRYIAMNDVTECAPSSSSVSPVSLREQFPYEDISPLQKRGWSHRGRVISDCVFWHKTSCGQVNATFRNVMMPSNVRDKHEAGGDTKSRRSSGTSFHPTTVVYLRNTLPVSYPQLPGPETAALQVNALPVCEVVWTVLSPVACSQPVSPVLNLRGNYCLRRYSYCYEYRVCFVIRVSRRGNRATAPLIHSANGFGRSADRAGWQRTALAALATAPGEQTGPRLREHNCEDRQALRLSRHNCQESRQAPRLSQHNCQESRQAPRLSQHNCQDSRQAPRLSQHNCQESRQAPRLSEHNCQESRHASRLSEHNCQESRHAPRLSEHNCHENRQDPRLREHNCQESRQDPRLSEHNCQESRQVPRLSDHNSTRRADRPHVYVNITACCLHKCISCQRVSRWRRCGFERSWAAIVWHRN